MYCMMASPRSYFSKNMRQCIRQCFDALTDLIKNRQCKHADAARIKIFETKIIRFIIHIITVSIQKTLTLGSTQLLQGRIISADLQQLAIKLSGLRETG